MSTIAATTTSNKSPAMPVISVANPGRDWPSVKVSPILDVPMRDTAITRGPDLSAVPAQAGGTYYLTGTLGVPIQNQKSKIQNELDFDNCRQIKLWKSSDLIHWQEIGVVWDLEVDVIGLKGDADYPAIRWMRQAHKDPTRPDSPVCMGFKAPELHCIRGEWYICFSMNNEGAGLLKSVSGRPEGPYKSWSQILAAHGDPSMFEDDDGAVYWLFGGGWIARMTEDLRNLAEAPRLPRVEHDRPTEWAKAKLGAHELKDFPLTVGDHGAFLFKNRGRYYLTAARRTNRFNAACDDTFVAWSDSIYGPYSEPTLMVPHGGGVTVFRGPRSTAVPKFYYPQQAHYLHYVADDAKPREEVDRAKDDDTFYATFFGNDVRAICRDRPAFLPLEWTGPERWEKWEAQSWPARCESVPRKPQHIFTERGPWCHMKPLTPFHMRDAKVCVGHDGHYYYSGSSINHPGKLMIWRSRDLARWEELAPVWTYEHIEWLPTKLPYTVKPPEVDRTHVFWHTWVTSLNNTFYITFCIFGDPNYLGADPRMRGVGLLRSVTGKIEGPYESLGRIGGQVGFESGPALFINFEHQGKQYSFDWINWKNHVAEFTPETPIAQWTWQRIDGGIYEWMQRADCSAMESIADTPVFFFHSGGRPDGAFRFDDLTTYDVNGMAAETLCGPPNGTLWCLPHCGASNRFQDRNGYWWSSMFCCDQTGPWWARFGLAPLRVEKRPGGDLLVDVEDHPDDYQKKIMGGGSIAEVKTVQETINSCSTRRTP